MNNAVQTADTFSPAVLLVCLTLVSVFGSDSVLVCPQGPPAPGTSDLSGRTLQVREG